MVIIFVWQSDGQFLPGKGDIDEILMRGAFEAISMAIRDGFDAVNRANRSRLSR